MKKFFALDEKLTMSNLQQERQRVIEGLLDYIYRFKDLSLICYDPVEEERLMDICIIGMLYEYCPYPKNLQIPSFTRLVEASRRISMSVRKLAKGLTSQTPRASRQPLKWESKNVEVAMVVETKIASKGKKRERERERERNDIPPPFSILAEELYSILEAWVKDGVVVLPEYKHKATKEEK